MSNGINSKPPYFQGYAQPRYQYSSFCSRQWQYKRSWQPKQSSCCKPKHAICKVNNGMDIKYPQSDKSRVTLRSQGGPNVQSQETCTAKYPLQQGEFTEPFYQRLRFHYQWLSQNTSSTAVLAANKAVNGCMRPLMRPLMATNK